MLKPPNSVPHRAIGMGKAARKSEVHDCFPSFCIMPQREELASPWYTR